jgi:hypothetical protein
MAKGKSDVILRDRLQFTFSGTGDRTTLYGRLDLQDYVSAVDRKALSIKEIYMQFRPGATAASNFFGNTGEAALINNAVLVDGQQGSCLKMFATTRAYELASQVGIGSPDVCHLETIRTAAFGVPTGTGQGLSLLYDHTRYGPQELHPDGFAVISDLLVGVAADNLDFYDDDQVEIDILVIAEPITVTQSTLTQMLTQQTDL